VPSASTRSITALIYEALQLGGVVADDLALSLCGKVAELALDVFLIEIVSVKSVALRRAGGKT
jgi:hypothetical protein